MQFQYNSDYPGLLHGSVADTAAAVPSRDPPAFPPTPSPTPCARITTRVYHPPETTTSGGGGISSGNVVS